MADLTPDPKTGIVTLVRTGDFVTLKLYQTLAHTTSLNTCVGDDPILYAIMGLVGEAGELADKAKKVYRDNGGEYTPEMQVALAYELGDVLWYVAEVATQMNIPLDQIATSNLKKLESRSSRGKIQGSGDER